MYMSILILTSSNRHIPNTTLIRSQQHGQVEPISSRYVGDAVEGVDPGLPSGGNQPRHIHDPSDLPSSRVDAVDLIALPDVGPDLVSPAVELVEHAGGLAAVCAVHAARGGQAFRVPEGQGAGTVAHHQLLSGGADSPALTVVVDLVQLLEGVGIPPECGVFLPRQLPYGGVTVLIDVAGDPFAEVAAVQVVAV